MSVITKIVNDKLYTLFQSSLPDSLYLSHYDLSKELGGTPTAWSNFLKDPENKRFIEREIASIAESAARRALNTLSDGSTVTSQQVSALKEILKNSELIQQKSNSKQTIIITHIPKKEGK